MVAGVGLEPHGLAFSLRRKGYGRFGGSDSPPDCHSLPPYPPSYSPVGLITRHLCGTIPSVFKEKNTIRRTVFSSLPPYLVVNTISRKVEFARGGYIFPFRLHIPFFGYKCLYLFMVRCFYFYVCKIRVLKRRASHGCY